MNKSELRKEVKRILAETDTLYFEQAGKAISEKVIGSAEFINSNTVFVYVSTETEPDTSEIIEAALRLGKTVCVPKCVSKTEMKAVRIKSTQELKKGCFGIREPKNCENTINCAAIDLAVIPCMAASHSGKRLGHGAGYYDRFLAESTAYKICLCFEKLIYSDIPVDNFDIETDITVTEI